MRKFLVFIAFLGFSTLTSAQGFYIEPAFRYSKHIPFPDFSDYPVHEADLRLGWQTTGEKAWQQGFNYPNFGLGLRFEHNTMKDYFDGMSQTFITLGNCYSAYGFCNGHLIRRKNFQFDYTWGVGLSYWPNSGNRFISTPLTVHLTLDFGPVFRLSEHWDLLARAVLSHGSNGAIFVPNKGVNVFGGQVGLRYFPKGRAGLKEKPHDSIFSKMNAVYILNGIGFYESTAIDGLRCTGNTFQIGYTRTFHPCFRFGGGIDVLFSGENRAMYEVNGALERFTTADYLALAPFVSFDLLYGDLVLHLSFARYVLQPAEYLPKGYQKYYERLALHYHFGPQKRFFAGAGMKVHLDCIDYIEWTVGMDLFSWKAKRFAYSP
ncbi:MAG: acyloxyacyl hydrolase [Bacteroidales bacterium]|nr:acyloxyacyl hydrolase [Bacteroidales bacterium]